MTEEQRDEVASPEECTGCGPDGHRQLQGGIDIVRLDEAQQEGPLRHHA